MDVDLLVVADHELDPDMWTELRREATRIDIRRGDADDPFRAVIRLDRAGEFPVDVLVGRFSWQRDVIRRAKAVEIGGTKVPVVEAADLILLKLFAGGTQDLWDVRRLLDVVASREAVAREVDTRVEALPRDSRDYWERLRRGDTT